MISYTENSSFKTETVDALRDDTACSDDLISSARDYFARDFPNPGRVDCPPTGAIPAMLRAGRRADDQLLDHLFGCSECFREYRSALQAQRESSEQRTSWWNQVIEGVAARPIQSLAGAAALLLVTAGGVYLWQRGRKGREQLLASNPPTPVRAPSPPAA